MPLGIAIRALYDKGRLAYEDYARLDDLLPEAEAAQDSRPLDVERLVEAFNRYFNDDRFSEHDGEQVAAEYARLAEKPHD